MMTSKMDQPKPNEQPQQPEPTGFDALLSRMGARERATAERHLAACDAEADPGHGRLWRRLVSKLAELAPLPVRTLGPDALMFFIPDGKYRMQVFAIEDRRDGTISLYLPDVIAEARGEKLLKDTDQGYVIDAPAPGKHPLSVRAMNGSKSDDQKEHIKNLTGWNRKAMCVTFPNYDPPSPQVAAVERLCAIAAAKWAPGTGKK